MADDAMPITIELGCAECGAHAVIIPADAEEDDTVGCDNCGKQLATIAEFRSRIADIALGEADRTRESRLSTIPSRH